MLHKTLDDAIKTVREVIAEEGEDYVYTDNYEVCYYSIEGKAACIVGRVLDKWGVLPEDVDSTNKATSRNGMFAYELLHNMEEDGELSVDPEAVDLLQTLQTCQDQGLEWGKALTSALSELEN